MDALIKTLKTISLKHPLDHFEWGVPQDTPISIPSNIKSGYEKNIFLKEALPDILSNDQSLDSHYWVIQKWGGIGSFKRNQRNDERITKFIKEMSAGILTKQTFECISSLSKVASFLKPSDFAIYDSRAIYTLNWLLFNHTNSNNLFPQPNGRSSELAKFDMQTIFRLAKRKTEYRSHKTAFHDYCEIAKHLSHEVFCQPNKPYLIEMLLFMVAPTWVVNNIEKSVTLEINCNA